MINYYIKYIIRKRLEFFYFFFVLIKQLKIRFESLIRNEKRHFFPSKRHIQCRFIGKYTLKFNKNLIRST
jgi:hypothetical protein